MKPKHVLPKYVQNICSSQLNAFLIICFEKGIKPFMNEQLTKLS